MATTRRPMGSLEAAVLDVLWSTDEALKPGDVQARLDIDPPVTYSTVMTILRRLWEKDLVKRHRAGKAFYYEPIQDREERVAELMTEAFAAASDSTAALGHFVARLSQDDASILRRVVRRRR